MVAPLQCGPFGLNPSELGTGPGGDTGTPKWSATRITPTLSTIEQTLADAQTHGVLLFLLLAGARNTFTDNVGGSLIYNKTKYETNVRKWTVAGGATAAQAAAVTSALNDRRAIVYAYDEPAHTMFAGSITPEAANSGGLLYKEIWPGCLTCVRIDGEKMLAWGTPSGGWTGFDYGMAQYEGHPQSGISMAQYWDTQRSILLSLDLGMVPMINFVDSGLKNGTLNGVSACWPCGNYPTQGGASGVLKGSYTGTAASGTFYSCGNVPSGENRFFPSPDWIRAAADEIFDDPDAIAFVGFSPYSTPSARTDWLALWNQSNFVSANDYMLNKLATRPTFNGFRIAKGSAPPPANLGVQHIASASAVGASVTVPTHLAGDLLVFTAVNNAAATVPSLPTGKTSIATGSGNSVALRAGYVIATGAGTTSGTWTNATEVEVSVYRGAHPTTPIGASDIGAFGNDQVLYKGLTLTVTNNTSWVYAAAVHATATNLHQQLPTGTLLRTNVGKIASFDTNGPKTSWAESQKTVNASGGSRTVTIELVADPAGSPPPVNDPPVLATITDKTVQEGSLLTFTATATDPENDTINFTLLPGINPVPSGATIGLTSGIFNWTPTTPQVGTHNVIIRATDVTGTNPQNLFDEQAFTITVTEIPGNEDPPPEEPPPSFGSLAGAVSAIT